MLIDNVYELEQFCLRAASSDVVAIDTEFIRERFYRPKLCLVQLGTGTEQVAVDPLAIYDPAPLKELFENQAVTKVLHACTQDMEVLLDWCGYLPHPIFDTQLAYSLLHDAYQVGYGPMVEQYCHVTLAKSESMTDWSQRPLNSAQLAYALDDVKYLPDIWHMMLESLDETGRSGWLDEDFAHACDPQTYRHNIREAFRKVKRVSSLSHRQLAVAREVAAWREKRAESVDKPRRWVMSDELLIDICKAAPKNIRELGRIRGISNYTETQKNELIYCVRQGLRCPQDDVPQLFRHAKPTYETEAVCDLLYAVARQIAHRENISLGILCSRDDLLDYLDHRDESVLSRGWRYNLLGTVLDSFLAGTTVLSAAAGKIELIVAPS